jgi:cytochrome c peroxidase
MHTRGLTPASLIIPADFPTPLHTYQDNPLTKEGIELGRRLFYEPLLSVDNNHPCSSCHEQVLFNLAWYPSFHWDGAFKSLEEESIHPITAKTEMGEQFRTIKRKLEKVPYYQRAFREVFHTYEIEPYQILRALAQFTGTMVSANSKYDQVKRSQGTFTAQEASGYQLFKAKCATCHPEPLFTDFSYRNIGLPVDPFLKDYGRMLVTKKKEDSLLFRVPTLRNVLLSSNYMHDGRFMTLQQCINHYRVGIVNSATLDPLLKNGIPLNDRESTDLVAFLKTLTDSSFVQNPNLAKPE